ncbi:MAG: class I SAM-dependent methyltransferase, partial [Sphingobium sp.]
MKLFVKVLRRLVSRGQLTVIFHDGRRETVGSPDPALPAMSLVFRDRRVPFDILRDPRLGMAEAYIDGRVGLEGGGIMELVSLLRANNAWEDGRSISAGGFFKRGAKLIKRALWRANHRARSKANVAHHYDLSGALYALFLDRDRQYSCAYYPDVDNEVGISLEQAQEDKKAHIAAKLHLKPGMKVLDIGCGWGGMALYLNRTCDVDVTGITLSQEQLKVARARAEEAGVADRV